MSALLFKLMLLCVVMALAGASDDSVITENAALTGSPSDLQTSATSAKLLNLGSLFGYGNSGSYPYRPSYNPTGNGYYPSSGYPSSGYPTSGYPSSGYPSSGYPSSGYPSSGYPSSGYPSNGYNPNPSYYPNSGYYPSTTWNVGGGSYYPSSGGYYPSTGTNILGGGNGGYGGYGGNGGLRQYSGYWNSNYVGQRNRGFGYYTDTDRFGLPKKSKHERFSSRDRSRMTHSCRGYD